MVQRSIDSTSLRMCSVVIGRAKKKMIERPDWAFDNPYDDDEVLCDDCGEPLYEVEDEDGKTKKEEHSIVLSGLSDFFL